MKLVTVSQMKAIEKEADASGLTYDQMMENAGHGLAEVIQDFGVEEEEREAFGLVGPGSNGGDTLVALSLLAADGCGVGIIIQAGDDGMTGLVHRAELLGNVGHHRAGCGAVGGITRRRRPRQPGVT